jgi:ubiquinone/menaquinone biosynthesis C-methylase UbiE
MSEEQIKEAVRKRYGELAKLDESCCNSCCATTKDDEVPFEALAVEASCGSPLSHVSVNEGEVVLDLGSGGGVDVFRASKLVGESGRVIGLDATPEMVFRARETAKKYGYRNVEFRLGEIEHMPIEESSVDLVISNCVLNLVPNKALAFKEIYRVLRPGGRLAISDMVATGEKITKIKPEEWAACIQGAVSMEEYKTTLEKTGFRAIEALDESHAINEEMYAKQIAVKSVAWTAKKPYNLE